MEAANALYEQEMCPEACCGKPVTECKCGPDCKHCDCYAKNNMNEAGNFDLTPQQRKLANLGRVLMDLATTTKDDNLSNMMAKVGNELTNFGATFGPKNVDELMAKTGASKVIIQKLLAHAQAVSDHKASLANDHEDGGLDDTDTDSDFEQPDDAEDAIAADRAARARR